MKTSVSNKADEPCWVLPNLTGVSNKGDVYNGCV